MTVSLNLMDLEDTPKFRHFDWEKAKTFYYVAKHGSFMSAARFLNISQPALSRQVIALEQHLGCPLFTRHRDGLNLTRKGEELFAIIGTTFIDLKGFTRDTHAKTAANKKRKIRIATTHAITAYILGDLIFKYNEEYPDIIFEIISSDHLIDIVLNDVDITIRPYDSAAQGVQQEPLFTLEKWLYASPKYLEKYGEPRVVEDLKEHRIIAPAHPQEYPYSELTWILKLGMPKGQFHEPVFTSNSIECLIKAAKNGVGIIGSYPKMEIIRQSNLTHILPDVKDKEIQLHFIYPNYLKKDTKIAELKEHLRRALCFQDSESGGLKDCE
jgi:DNA-binding transcriptional LysR family regulator